MNKLLLTVMMAVLTSMSAQAITVTDTIFNRAEHEEYAFGADVSFVPQMEGWGTRWLDKNGVQKDILQILKEQGINSIRLRVWTVNSGASSKQEVVSMCKRAKAKNMDVMIDFHYSDTWADPGNQTIPSAWTDHSVAALSQNVYDHTYEVLKAIKDAGVTPRWVQVGNETKRGMLYPVGQTNKGGSVAFAKFVLSGYNAVKAVDSTMQVIVHLPDGHDNSLYRSIFDGLKKNGAKWDIIGLSAYPRWSHLDGPTMINKVMNNINDLKRRYGKPCMVVETGHYPDKAIEGNQYLVGVMDRMIKNGDLGCFYWEPESMGGYDMGAWDESTRRPTVMMDAFLGIRHTTVSWLMKAWMKTPSKEQTMPADNVVLEAGVLHVRDGRIKSVDIYYDKRFKGSLNAEPYQWSIDNADIGVHTTWAKATDTSRNTQMTDTITFFVGESTKYDDYLTENPQQRGGTASWNVNFAAAGNYRMVIDYTADGTRGTEVWVGNDSLARIYFYKNEQAYQTFDVNVTTAGQQVLRLKSTSVHGLPAFNCLRIFPLDGQPLPGGGEQSDIATAVDEADVPVSVYSLSGMLLYRTRLSELGISIQGRLSKVVVLPGQLSGATSRIPCIVRKDARR